MLELNAMLAAANLVVLMLSATVAGYYIYRVVDGGLSPDAQTIAKGVALVALGLTVHRAYWSANRLLELHGADYLLTELYSTYSWITLVPLAIIVLGYGYHISPLLETFAGPYWVWMWVLTMVPLWVLISSAL